MEKIIAYKTNDGNVFDSEEKAVCHEKKMVAIYTLNQLIDTLHRTDRITAFNLHQHNETQEIPVCREKENILMDNTENVLTGWIQMDIHLRFFNKEGE